MHGHSSMRSATKQVRGLGSAHEGTGHFWLQRVSALALIPLSVWFITTLVAQLLGAEHADIAAHFRDPIFALAMLVFVIALAVHARLGVQVIIEDYVHAESKKLALILLNNAAMLAFALASIASIIQLHFIGI